MIGYLSHTNADPKKLCPHILKNELYRKYTPKKLYIAIFCIPEIVARFVHAFATFHHVAM